MLQSKRHRFQVAGCAAILAVLMAVPAEPALAQAAPIVYPSAGQTMDQQAQDEGACRNWATQQTGIYPYQSAPTYYGDTSSGAPILGGAARGAALGAVGGAIAGDAGKGAAIGAGVGATAGLIRKNRDRRQQANANEQAMMQYQSDMGRYNQAFAACMQGRGYVVR
ncbi:OmpA family protein [Dongia mobilis]|uniref:OmpA family protein n=2 Tax=Dongia mobilis TaxID=578943 RepID=A0A4R6WSK2_9PROT|nr:OmpA family protein [Dongia mobilis]